MQIIIKIVRQSRRSRRGTEAEQAALAERPLLRVIVGAGRLRCAILALVSGGRRRRPGRRDALACGLVVGRHLAVRRINDDGCSNLPPDLSVCRALVEPETIIPADGAAPALFQSFKVRFRLASVATHRRRRAIQRQRLVASGAFGPALGFGSLQSFGLFLCQEGRIAGPSLKRRHRGEVVGALQVRMPIRLKNLFRQPGPFAAAQFAIR